MSELGLINHALLLCYIEDRFYNYTNMYWFGFDDEVMYPSYMVVTTTFLGLALVRKLVVDCRIGQKAVWILTCLYSSKLVMLFITSKSVLWVSALLLLAVSPPLLLYKYVLNCISLNQHYIRNYISLVLVCKLHVCTHLCTWLHIYDICAMFA